MKRSSSVEVQDNLSEGVSNAEEPKTKKQKQNKLARNGISTTINKSQISKAQFKQRYEDFIVSEIAKNNSKVSLQTLTPPQTLSTDIDSLPFVVQLTNLIASLDSQESIQDDTVTALELATQIAHLDADSTGPLVVTGPIMDKQKRQLFHDLFKLSDGLESKTTPDKEITVSFSKKKNKKINFKDLGGNYCEFSLYKENRDTMDALQFICSKSRLTQKTFSYAGNKDKRGKTVQRVTAHKVTAETLFAIVNKNGFTRQQEDVMFGRGLVRVGDFEYKNDKLSLGDLTGNHFVVVLRELAILKREEFELNLNSLKDNGFINYFGLQRFGTQSIPTQDIGIAMLKGDWNLAADLLLNPREGDTQRYALPREDWKANKNPKSALKLFPKNCIAETSILYCLQEQKPKEGSTEIIFDYQKALNSIPRNLKSLYLHAFQSFVWNHMVTQRFDLYGPKKIVIGDIVLMDSPSSETTTSTSREPQHAFVIQTDEDLARFGIEDVVLPLPGYDVIYPKNEVGERYVKFMKGLGLDLFDLKRADFDMSLPGAYRKVLGTVKECKEFKEYEDVNVPLAKSCFDELEVKVGAEGYDLSGDDKKLAVVVEFELDSSCYASMCLREVADIEEDVD